MAKHPKTQIPIHDHFDGSAHCVECAGECKLTGAEAELSALIRSLLEGAAFNGRGVSFCIEFQLKELLGNRLTEFRERAKDCALPISRR